MSDHDNWGRRAFLASVGAAAFCGCTGDADETGPATSPSGTRTGTPTASTTPTETATETPTATPEPVSTIGFAGDAMVGRDLNPVYGEKGISRDAIWAGFQRRLNAVDGVCCNLECCLSTRGERYPDRAYYFRGNPDWAVPALNAGNVAYASLANNHAMDFGEVALLDTIDVLDEGGIAHAGTGKTPEAAREPATVTIGDHDLAIVSVSDEYEFYAATEDRGGIAWAKTNDANDRTKRVVGEQIERAKATDPDLLVVSLHWGENWIEQPSQRLVDFGHWLVDRGADLVHGHSAHVVQGVELYGDGVILHDTGDLVDDFGTKGDLGNDKSYLFEVTVHGDDVERVRLRPFSIASGVARADEEQAAWLRETMRQRSQPFDTTYERAGDGLVVEV